MKNFCAIIAIFACLLGPQVASSHGTHDNFAKTCSTAFGPEEQRIFWKQLEEYRDSIPTTKEIRKILVGAVGRPRKAGDGYSIFEITPEIFLFRYSAQRDMTRTFLRFQEYYESPEFQGKIFSLAEYKRWYRTTTPSGKFTYFADWGGYNFPSEVLKPFFDGDFKYQTAREKVVVNFLRPYAGKSFSVIGVYGDRKSLEHPGETLSNLTHEIAHAFYHWSAEYRKQVDAVVASVDSNAIKALERHLIEIGYASDPEVLKDEYQAYLIANIENFVFEGVVGLEPYKFAMTKLSEIYLRTLRRGLLQQ